MSPPIQVPKESGNGASGRRARYSREQPLGRVGRLCSKNQSPWRISSVRRGRSVTNLVGLPQDRDLLAELALDVLLLRPRGSGVERCEQLGHTNVREQVRPPRCFGGMRSQYELERESRRRHAVRFVDVAEPLECIGERLARRLLILRGVLPAAA